MLRLNATMTDRLKIFHHAGVSVMWCDYSRLDEKEMLDLLDQAAKLGKTMGRQVCILADFAKTPRNKAFNEGIKYHGKDYYKSGYDVKVAVLGIDSTLKRIIVNTTMIVTKIKNVKLFEHKEEALTWLCKDVRQEAVTS